MRRLVAGDYADDAVTAAKALVGAWLCRRMDDGTVIRRRITETEAYCGEEDTACPAHRHRLRLQARPKPQVAFYASLSRRHAQAFARKVGRQGTQTVKGVLSVKRRVLFARPGRRGAKPCGK